MSESLNVQDTNNTVKVDVISKIPVDITVVLGKTSMTIDELLKKKKGDFISLDSEIGGLVSIFANDKLIARGEVVIHDSRVGVTIKELVS